MKKIIFIALALIVSNSMLAQGTQITLYGAYVFDDSFDSYYSNNEFYEGKIEDGLQWGVGLEYPLNSSFGIEAIYLRQDTNSPTTFSTGILNLERVNFDLAINYLMLGGVHHLRKPDQPLEFYGGLMAGVMFGNIENPENGNNGNVTKFSWGVKGGTLYWFSDNIGLKLQVQLTSAVQSAGGGFYFDGYAGGASISTYSSIYQFSVGGGLVVALN